MSVEVPKEFYVKGDLGTYKINVLNQIFATAGTTSDGRTYYSNKGAAVGSKVGASMRLSTPWNMAGKTVTLINGEEYKVRDVCDVVTKVSVDEEISKEQMDLIEKNLDILLG